MPDGAGGGEPAGVVILTAEDDLSDTVRPRLDAAGADVSKIAALTAVRRTTDGGGEVLDTPTLLDLEALRQAIAFVSAALVIIDPSWRTCPGRLIATAIRMFAVFWPPWRRSPPRRTPRCSLFVTSAKLLLAIRCTGAAAASASWGRPAPA